MNFLFILILMVTSSLSYGKSVCTYLYNCAQCVIEVSTDPPIKISSSDLACLDRLRDLDNLNIDVPRNRTEIDNNPLGVPSNEMSDFARSSLSASIESIYESYQEQKRIADFYADLPNILRTKHQELIQGLKEDEIKRSSVSGSHIEAFQNEVNALANSISTNALQVKNSSSFPQDQTNDLIENIGLRQEIIEAEKKLKSNGIHGGFPNFAGTKIPNMGGGELGRNNEISDSNARKVHLEILNHSNHFSRSGSQENADKLIEEARDLRHGKKSSFPLTNRVQVFELKQAHVKDQRNLLLNRISGTADSSKRQNLEIVHDISGNLLSEGRKDFYTGDLDEGEHWTEVAKEVIDLGLGFIPVVSTGKDLVEAITGFNFITGKKLETSERAFSALSVLSLGSGSLAKNGIKIFDKLSTSLIDVNKIASSEVLGKNIIQKEASLFRKFGDKTWKRGDDLNEAHRKELGISADDFINPWKSDRRVMEFTTKEEIVLHRIFSKDISGEGTSEVSEELGRWYSRINPTEMGSKAEIRDVLSLPQENNVSSYVTIIIPAGTRVRMGVVAGSEKLGSRGGAIQYDLMNIEIPGSWVIGGGKI